MRGQRAPATVVVCVGVPAGASSAACAALADVATRTGVPVTWVTRPAEMAAVLDAVGTRAAAFDMAVAVEAAVLQSRPLLRSTIASARGIAGRVGCAVAAGIPVLEHRSLLVEQGIHTIAVGGFDGVTRSSRRPPPAGWPCRSVVWGLWEVRAVPHLPRTGMGRLLPWAFGPRVAAGSLTVVHVETAAAARLERIAMWVARQADRVRAACLSDLPELLRAAGQSDAGSVLKRAA